MRLLVTRPEPGGERTAAALRARGHEVALAPLLRIEPIEFALPEKSWSAVVMTSANAARGVAAHAQRDLLTALDAFTVGRPTAEAARAAGFRAIYSADGDKDDLIDLLRAHRGRELRPLLYLAGEERAGDLGVGDMPIVTVVSYRAVKVERFPRGIVDALAHGALNGVLHFSRRSAEAYVECAARERMREHALKPVQFCLSRQVAQPLVAAGASTIRIAPHPDEAAMIDLVGQA